jgi:hypothetical protein
VIPGADVIVYDCKVCGHPVYMCNGAFVHFAHHDQDHVVDPVVVILFTRREVA